MNRPHRSLIPQRITWITLSVALTPTPLNQAAAQTGLSAMYESLIFSLVSTAATSVFLGNSNVLATGANGLEIRAGVPVQLSIHNQRMLYEVQGPLVDNFCLQPESIPFVVWDVSEIYLITTGAPKNIAVGLFQAPFI